MDEVALGNDATVAVFSVAFMRGDTGEPVGTDHLLTGLTSVSATGGLLAVAGLTRTVAMTLLKRRLDRRPDPNVDDGDRGAGPQIVVTAGGRPMPFTAAAAEAVRRAASGRQPYNPVDLLLALLNDAGCRAAEMLRVCGAESAGLRAAIEGRPGIIDDSVAPELQTMRDRAIGRTAYPSPGLRDPLTAFAVATHVNLIGQPMLWIRLEAQEQARAHGRVKSDDLLLAVAAAYEIARAYPYMSTPGDSRWGGAEALWRAGARYADLKRLHLYVDLGSEAPLSNRVVKGARDTGTLLRQLLDAGDRRAVRLLAAGGVARP